MFLFVKKMPVLLHVIWPGHVFEAQLPPQPTVVLFPLEVSVKNHVKHSVFYLMTGNCQEAAEAYTAILINIGLCL